MRHIPAPLLAHLAHVVEQGSGEGVGTDVDRPRKRHGLVARTGGRDLLVEAVEAVGVVARWLQRHLQQCLSQLMGRAPCARSAIAVRRSWELGCIDLEGRPHAPNPMETANENLANHTADGQAAARVLEEVIRASRSRATGRHM